MDLKAIGGGGGPMGGRRANEGFTWWRWVWESGGGGRLMFMTAGELLGFRLKYLAGASSSGAEGGSRAATHII